MTFIWSFLGTMLGIVGAISIIIFVIYLKIAKIVGKSNLKELKNAIKNSANLQKEEYCREKTVTGMTSLLEPNILNDFPDFNKDLLFSIAESNIKKILKAIQNLDISEISGDDELDLIYDGVKKTIEDYKSANINVKYNDIKFHRHAIKDYRKLKGKATVKVSSTLEYFYETNKKGVKTFSDVKKQTRYTSEFCYVYDESKFDDKQIQFSLNCPNCGAPIKETKDTVCEYCGSLVKAINLKAWKMISYKEDYN